MAWPANGDTNWNDAMKSTINVEHDTDDGTHKAVTATSLTTTGNVNVGSFINLGAIVDLTIGGASNVTATQSYHSIDTLGGAGTDNLNTIDGGTEGDLLIIKAVNSARTVVCKDAVGNLRLEGDFSMDVGTDRLTLLYDGVNWVELSRSNND